jgi:hypothetical protein
VLRRGRPDQERDGKRSIFRMASGSADAVTLLRWFIVLPEPLPLPDGWSVSEPVPNMAVALPAPDDPAVTLIFHQVESQYGRARGAVHAMRLASLRDPALPQPKSAEETGTAGVVSHYTVVEAITTAESPDPPPEAWSGSAADLPARSDAFMRCLRLIDDLARGYRMAAETPYGIPSYERIMSPVLRYSAPAVRQRVSQTAHVVRSTGVWSGPQAILLDHSNVPDTPGGPLIEGELAEKFDFWISAFRSGLPLATWRDQIASAKRAFDSEGDYAQAVVLANTACEVLIDGILALLLWEEGLLPEKAAALFEEGGVLRRVQQELPPRLKGNWSVRGSAGVARWFADVYVLRHRVVHGGYKTTRPEARGAIRGMRELERFMFDRVAARRTAYPLVTLLTLAESGLSKRGLWNGKIKRLAEQTDPSAARSSLRAYYDALVAERGPR